MPKSPKVHYTTAGDCYVRINAFKKKIKGERVTQLAYAKGSEPYEKKAIKSSEIDEYVESGLLN